MAGHAPAIPINEAKRCHPKRGHTRSRACPTSAFICTASWVNPTCGAKPGDDKPMRWPRRQFPGRAADGVFDRAWAGLAHHGEADKEGGGGDGGGEFVGALAKRHAPATGNGGIRFAIPPFGLRALLTMRQYWSADWAWTGKMLGNNRKGKIFFSAEFLNIRILPIAGQLLYAVYGFVICPNYGQNINVL
jgi:hypothetical protein